MLRLAATRSPGKFCQGVGLFEDCGTLFFRRRKLHESAIICF